MVEAFVTGGVIGWNICGELWWSSKWSLISAVERILCRGAVLIGSKLWSLRANNGCPRFPERFSVDLACACVPGGLILCVELTDTSFEFAVPASVKDGVDTLLVNMVGIEGAMRLVFTRGEAVVTGAGVKSGWVMPLRLWLTRGGVVVTGGVKRGWAMPSRLLLPRGAFVVTGGCV